MKPNAGFIGAISPFDPDFWFFRIDLALAANDGKAEFLELLKTAALEVPGLRIAFIIVQLLIANLIALAGNWEVARWLITLAHPYSAADGQSNGLHAYGNEAGHPGAFTVASKESDQLIVGIDGVSIWQRRGTAATRLKVTIAESAEWSGVAVARPALAILSRLQRLADAGRWACTVRRCAIN